MTATFQPSEVPMFTPIQSSLQRGILRAKALRRCSQPAILCFLLLLFPAVAFAQSGSPFDTGFTALQNLFTGTVAKVASLIAIVIGGYQFAHGEPGSKKNRILSARFSEGEYTELEKHAWANGVTLGDWVRETLLDALQTVDPQAVQTHIFTELIAIQMLMMNALEPLLRGETLSHEQTAQLFREVQATKAARAQNLLLKRTQSKER
jgi:type IV secretory pathway VirB2 component (pilin)